MRCEDVRDRLSELHDGGLPVDVRVVIDAHLASCAACRADLEGIREVVGLLRRSADMAVPAGLMARVSAALAAEPAAGVEPMGCDEVEDCLSAHLEGTLEGWEQEAFGAHLAHCMACRRVADQLGGVVELLGRVRPPAPPADLPERVRAALRAEAPAAPPLAVVAGAVPAPRRWTHLASAVAGAAAACVAFLVWTWVPGVGLPRIEATAVAVRQDVAVNIAFDLDERVDGVIFQVDLPEGLQFIDERSQPMLAQSVSWRGSLEKGRTVVPILVRGVRPGRYAIEAYVRKGPLKRRTTVVLPVEG